MNEKRIIETAKVELSEGISKKTGNPYIMLKILTGDKALDGMIKPIFVTEYIARDIKKLK